MPYGSPYDEEARFFRQFLKMGSPISPSNLRITKEEKFSYVFSPIFVIWRFNSPTGGETENIFSFRWKKGSQMSNQGVRREKLSFFHKSGPNGILFSSWGVKGEKIINFHALVEKRLSNVQPGSEDTQQPRKEVHR